MAVAFDASSVSGSSVSQASYSWTHTPTGTPRGVLVYTFVTGSTSDNATAVTYGGVSMTAVSGVNGRATTTGAGLTGDCKAWFLGSSIPTGAQTVSVTRTNNTDTMYGMAFTVTAGANTETNDPQKDELATGNITLSEKSVTDGQSSGTNNSVRFAGINVSALSVDTTSGGPTTAPADVVAPGASCTHLQSVDLGATCIMGVRETTAGIGARNVGFYYSVFSKTTENVAAVYLAVREATSAAPSATPAALLAMMVAFEDSLTASRNAI